MGNPAAAYAVRVALLASAYLVAGRLGLLLAIPPGYATALWPASGIALAALLLFGWRLWPGVLLGSFLVNVAPAFDGSGVAAIIVSLATALSIGLGAAAQAVVGSALIRYLVGFPNSLTQVSAVIRFLALGGPISSVVSASWGVSTLWWTGRLPENEYVYSWFTWYVGDAIGVMIVAPLVLVALGQPREIWRRRLVPVALPLCVALAAAIVLFVKAGEYESDRIENDFAEQARNVTAAVRNNLDRFFEVLHSLRSYFDSSQFVERQEFTRFVSRALARNPGIHALSWNPVIKDGEREAMEQAVQDAGYPDFSISERDPKGALVPAARRPQYIAVYYIEPYLGNADALGYDVASNAIRKEALDRSRDTGQVVVTRRIKLVQEKGDQWGALFFMPVYEPGKSLDMVLERRDHLRGYVTGVLRISDMLRAALIDLGLNEYEARLSDLGGGDLLARFHASGATSGNGGGPLPAAAAASLGRSVSYDVADGVWQLDVLPTAAYLRGQRSWTSWSVLAAALLFTCLLGAFLLVLTGRATELREINNRMACEISRRRSAQEALFNAKERAEVTLHSIGEAVITTDADGMIDFMNPVAEALTGWTRDEASNRSVDEVIQVIDAVGRVTPLGSVARCLKSGRTSPSADRATMRARDQNRCEIESSAAPIMGRDGAQVGTVLVFRDVTAARRQAQKIAYQASHDALTGLVNRREFVRRLERALSDSAGREVGHALAFMDLDGFKSVNDGAGHVAGDELLRRLASQLERKIRECDTLARLGGDEFALLLENCPVAKAVEIAETLVATVRGFRFSWEGNSFHIGLSVGVVEISASAVGADQLLMKADIACYSAKRHGRNHVQIYHGEAQTPPDPAPIVGSESRAQALEDGRFRLYARSLLPLAAGDDIERHELVIRLIDTHGQIVPPAVFFGAAERDGISGAIDRWVIDTALGRYRELFADNAVEIGINLCAMSLKDEALLDYIRDCLCRSEVPPGRVCFDIAEAVLLRNEDGCRRFACGVRELGCKLAIDGFGGGLSSLVHLQDLPLDYLKIDTRFVGHLGSGRMHAAALAAMVEISKAVGVQTIGEGVQSDKLIEALRALGVDFAQGDAVGAARPLDEIKQTMDEPRSPPVLRVVD